MALQRLLRRRALQWLAQREHSNAELRAKLVRWYSTLHHQQAMAAVGAGPQDGPKRPEAAVTERDIECVLQSLTTLGCLSEERFVDSRIRSRQSRFGSRRIADEIKRLGVQLDANQVRELQSTDLERARSIWQRRVTVPPADAAARARLMRFMAHRGFPPAVVRQLLREANLPDTD